MLFLEWWKDGPLDVVTEDSLYQRDEIRGTIHTQDPLPSNTLCFGKGMPALLGKQMKRVFI